jgi:type II secretory ATPase GspE/PulE/Tfp pilus assembly ATPase PilB-like protein
MVMTNEIARLTMARADTMQLGKQAQTDGMTTLLADGIRKIKEGLTSIEEVLSVATAGQEMIDE